MRVYKLSSLVKRSEARSYLKKYTKANPMSKQSHSDFFYIPILLYNGQSLTIAIKI